MILFTSKQVAQALNVSEETVRRWIRNGDLEAESLGKSYRIGEDEIKRFLKMREVSYDLTMFPRLSELIETAIRAGLNPAKIAIANAYELSGEKVVDNRVNPEQPEKSVEKNETADEYSFDMRGMEIEIETIITKMEKELEILRQARKILQERKGD